MGQITSGVGLVSGIDYLSLVDQLIQLQTGPRTQLEIRNAELAAQQVAYQDVSAKLLSVKSSVSTLSRSTVFRSTTASSSNESVASATSSTGAVPGSYTFSVSQLVRSQQVITDGFSDKDITPLDAGSISFDRAESALSTRTRLSALRGGEGVTRGVLTITDQSGRTADIDISTAVNIEDVLEAINTTTGIGVRASITDDGLTLTDISGGSGTLTVAESEAAESLGLSASGGVDASAASDPTGKLVSARLNYMGRETVLTNLNDGNGIRMSSFSTDFTITDRSGATHSVDLGEATSLGDVMDAIASATGGAVTAKVSDGGVRDGSSLTLVDTTGGGGNLVVADASGSSAATDLGIVGDVAGDEIVGGRLVAEMGSKLVTNLLGGRGLAIEDEIGVTNGLGATVIFDLAGAESVTDLVDQINAATSSIGVYASINGANNGIELKDVSGGSGSLTVTEEGGMLASELGIVGEHTGGSVDGGNLQLKYISEATRLDKLGIVRGQFTITDALNDSAVVDLTQGNEVTLGDVIDEINSKGLAIEARINDTGDGILIEDKVPTGTVPLQAIKIEERGSSTARTLGLLGEADEPGGDLDGSFETRITFSSEKLTLDTDISVLNDGEGLGDIENQNDIKITLKDGTEIELNFDAVNKGFDGDASTTSIADVIEFIESQVEAVTGNRDLEVKINDTESGLDVVDFTSGSDALRIEALNGSPLAADLGILGSTDPDLNEINGSAIVEITTLQDLANKINDAGGPAVATILNDGNPNGGYRMVFTAREAGESGGFVFDDGGMGVNARTITEAQDAAVFLGSSKDVLITSTTNTLDDLIPGTTITLNGTSETPVTINISENLDEVKSTIETFVTSFNEAVSTIDSYDSYNADTEERGLLLGDSTVSQIRNNLYNRVTLSTGQLTGTYKVLSQVGIRIGEGGVLTFDAARFDREVGEDRAGVIDLFTKKTTVEDDEGNRSVLNQGVLAQLDEWLESITNSFDGTLKQRGDTLNSLVEANQDRIEDIDEDLERERAKLEAEFIAMEIALAELQGQSSSLSQIQAIAPLTSSNS
ncbi:flagellar filament capping protein FliD [Mucisphaera calidilacus]|uniref:Filament cap protein n=1 Tax=Mucisphaera calidilacus TaxID=2527982 RepID=A0A518BY91_9BACT|nr:flagellar filament capping protein FliD [Mucisphaera calidilacus]QDU71947.1 Flagellar hook-associated protein 2 [Mucisphaera calidilacus]